MCSHQLLELLATHQHDAASRSISTTGVPSVRFPRRSRSAGTTNGHDLLSWSLCLNGRQYRLGDGSAVGEFDLADGRAGVSHAVGDLHPVGVGDLGGQHAVPARCGTRHLRGVRRQLGVHGRDGAVRGADRCRRRHRRATALVPAGDGHPRRRHARLRRVRRARHRGRAVRRRLTGARPRVLVLLGRRGGVARRRTPRHRVRAAARRRSSPRGRWRRGRR